jgi:hypothetical protein
MKTEIQINEEILNLEKEIENLKEYITFELNNWNISSKSSIISFTEQIETLIVKLDMLKYVLEINKEK